MNLIRIEQNNSGQKLQTNIQIWYSDINIFCKSMANYKSHHFDDINLAPLNWAKY